ncbi:RusA family crossover junction endodeoxyribonuclease [Priestia aryabhattai]|uniref:RusA family crossover junction endodeoxyribonuclease n=1 Tax=Priestia megaterium TaxID=1404 RepID=UPI003F96BFA7
MTQFVMSYDELPISLNSYIRPSARIVNGKALVHMYETKESKDWKKRFQAYLKREVARQKWDIELTKEGHWTLECVFIQSRTNQDNNNYFKVLCDSLTGIVIEDDKNVLVQTKRVLYDAKHPKFYAVLRPVDYIGIFNNKEAEAEFIVHNCSICNKKQDKCTILRKAREGRIQEDIEGNICKKRKG